MISLDMKSDTKTSPSSPLSQSTPSDEPTLSFSELLKGVSDKKDGKVIQNGSLILSLAADEKATSGTKAVSKGDALLALLKNEDTLVDKKEEPLELHPKLIANLSTKEIKALVAEAKNYLKDKILSSDDFKKSEIKELPKTLKGLVAVAKKLGVDVTKITVEDVKSHTDVKPKNSNIKTLDTKEVVDNKVALKDDKQNLKAEPLDDKFNIKDDKSALKVEVKEVPQDKKTVNLESKDDKVALKTEVKDDKSALKTEVKDDKSALKTEVKDDKVALKAEVKDDKSALKTEVLKDVRRDEKIAQIPKEIKATPLFKAQAVAEHTTTEQIVQVKTNSTLKVEQKTPKDKADETLKLLLRGDKPSMRNPSLTADFSVATAKVIAPTAVSDVTKSLEALLHGDAHSESAGAKTEALTTHKADSFEVKLNEAKQMIKYLSSDVKTAIEDYKSPFTRVKVQLNPQKLGEIDLTIVQRGKNLHVNISSNNTAVNTLAMNANELKVQLSNSGINNATLNFNNSSQNGENAQQQQQNHQNRQHEQKANEEYNYFENEDTNEEILSSLEIVVPNYA